MTAERQKIRKDVRIENDILCLHIGLGLGVEAALIVGIAVPEDVQEYVSVRVISVQRLG